ncbi:MAG: hypothetical protein WCZ89_09175, partial [Phycisphaerae bacterium]
IVNCNFLNNSAGKYQSNIPEEEYYYGGGAIFCRKSILNISNSSFSGNSSERYGAAISAVYSNIIFKNCSIVRNEGSPLTSMVSLGPAISQYYSTLSFENSDISGNIDGAIFGQGGSLTLKNCILTGNGVPNPNHWSNIATWAGVIITNGIVDIDGCTFSGNRSYRASAILVIGNLKLSNSIFWQNESIFQSPIVVGSGETEIKFCRIEDSQINISLSGPGNIDVDPCFVNPGYWDPNGTPADANDDFWVFGDYRLKSEGWRWDSDANEWTWDEVTSRCIDAGNPGSPLGDEPLTLDVDPLNRWGQNLRIDMGAYGGTAQASMAPYDWALLSDIDNNGTADFVDFAWFSRLWLEQDEEQFADFNRDGEVQNDDLDLLASDWLNATSWH